MLVTTQFTIKRFSNSFYLNYGYVIKRLDLQNLEMHVYNRLSSFDDAENHRIMDLLDFENDIEDGERIAEVEKILKKYLVPKLISVNSESDLLIELKKRPHLNDVPLVVKNHFCIEIQ